MGSVNGFGKKWRHETPNILVSDNLAYSRIVNQRTLIGHIVYFSFKNVNLHLFSETVRDRANGRKFGITCIDNHNKFEKIR